MYKQCYFLNESLLSPKLLKKDQEVIGELKEAIDKNKDKYDRLYADIKNSSSGGFKTSYEVILYGIKEGYDAKISLYHPDNKPYAVRLYSKTGKTGSYDVFQKKVYDVIRKYMHRDIWY